MYLGAKRRYINTLPFLSFRAPRDHTGQTLMTTPNELLEKVDSLLLDVDDEVGRDEDGRHVGGCDEVAVSSLRTSTDWHSHIILVCDVRVVGDEHLTFVSHRVRDTTLSYDVFTQLSLTR